MRTRLVVVCAVVTILTLLGGVGQAWAATVLGTPKAWTPQLATSGTDGSVEKVRQMVQCGSTVYAVGIFSQIKQNKVVYSRTNAFSFSATTGALTSWQPSPNGLVNSVALSADCSTAYLGGTFTTVKGTAVKNFVAVNTGTGDVVTTVAHNAAGQVSTVVRVGSHLIVGGYFTGINGSIKKYLVSLDPLTGKDDGYVNLSISGSYVYTDDAGKKSAQNATRVYNTALSPDGKRLLAMGVFTSVGGQARKQIAMLDLGSSAVTVDPWYSTEFDAWCAAAQPFYVQDAAWSPDGSTVYAATTGTKPANGPGFKNSDPRAGLCDAAVAFPSSATLVSHKWINYTGCDSLFSVAADSSAVYVGGHERWASNPNGCNAAGPGAVSAPGMSGLSPSTGQLVFNPTRSRGEGADDMLLTSAGLWVSSDNAQNSSQCGGVFGHAGICFLPY
jgi:hypothetical protein